MFLSSHVTYFHRRSIRPLSILTTTVSQVSISPIDHENRNCDSNERSFGLPTREADSTSQRCLHSNGSTAAILTPTVRVCRHWKAIIAFATEHCLKSEVLICQIVRKLYVESRESTCIPFIHTDQLTSKIHESHASPCLRSFWRRERRSRKAYVARTDFHQKSGPLVPHIPNSLKSQGQLIHNCL